MWVRPYILRPGVNVLIIIFVVIKQTTFWLFFGENTLRIVTMTPWGRCYDFENVSAETFVETLGVFYSMYVLLVYTKNWSYITLVLEKNANSAKSHKIVIITTTPGADVMITFFCDFRQPPRKSYNRFLNIDPARGPCYDHNFQLFWGEKISVFLKNQCYDQIFAKSSSSSSKKRQYFRKNFRRKCFKYQTSVHGMAQSTYSIFT
jgi:hypothetical protein